MAINLANLIILTVNKLSSYMFAQTTVSDKLRTNLSRDKIFAVLDKLKKFVELT